jgi:transposase
VSDPDSPSREELLAALAERDAVIEVLLAEIEQLKRRVGVDSSNSSMPPGADGPAARDKRAKQRRSKLSPRPRGGQARHEGHILQRVADPDFVEVLAPAGCGGCGRDLAGVAGRVASRIQVFDTTPPVKLQVTEYPDCWRPAVLAAGRPPGGRHRLGWPGRAATGRTCARRPRRWLATGI